MPTPPLYCPRLNLFGCVELTASAGVPLSKWLGLPGGPVVQNLPANAEERGFDPDRASKPNENQHSQTL